MGTTVPVPLASDVVGSIGRLLFGDVLLSNRIAEIKIS